MTLILCQDERRLGSTVETTSAPEEPAAQEIVVTATSCEEPVFFGAWLRPGAHVNAIGSNFLFESEVDQDVVCRANFVCIHPCKELRTETEDLLRDI
jgi:alanine dehydrogenase